MISMKSLPDLKVLAEIETNLIPGGIVFGIIEGDTMTWVKKSDSLDINSARIKIVQDKLRKFPIKIKIKVRYGGT